MERESTGFGANMHGQGSRILKHGGMAGSEPGCAWAPGRRRLSAPHPQADGSPPQSASSSLSHKEYVEESWSDGAAARFWGSHCPPPGPKERIPANSVAAPDFAIPTEWKWGDPERSHFARFIPPHTKPRSEDGDSATARPSHGDVDGLFEFEWREPPQPSSMEAPVEEFLQYNPDMIPDSEGSGTRRSRRLLPVYAGLATVVAAASFYLFSPGDYRIDANLLFLCARTGDASSRAWPLEKEVEILKSPRVLHLASRELVSGKTFQDRYRRSTAGRGSFGVPARSGDPAAQPEFPNYTATTKWLSENLCVTPEPTTGMATVSITGQDPDRLKEAMHAYLKHYARHRTELVADTALSGSPGRGGSPLGGPSTVRSEIRDELERVIAQQHECEMAIKLMDTGKGPFRGFLPENNLTGIPSLSAFQNKIVELEIKKQTLGSRFTTESKDVQAIDLEMKGVRAAMKERIKEHLLLLRQRAEELHGLKEALQGKTEFTASKKGTSGKRVNGKEAAQKVSLGSHDCLYLRERPFIAQRPFIARAKEYAAALFTGDVHQAPAQD
ncbi:MAG: hypothetical protein FJ118_03460 [Deltaproteobacteria bacterium]|nr:hypothetical protein [Deltaproteobacteria bacterium]